MDVRSRFVKILYFKARSAQKAWTDQGDGFLIVRPEEALLQWPYTAIAILIVRTVSKSRMNISRFIQICGMPLFASIAVLTLLLTIAAFWLVVKAKRDFLLSAFLPLCFLPLMLAVVKSLFGFLSAIELQLNNSAESLLDPGLMLTMNLVPLFFGAAASFLPATITMVGRWSLAWRASGIKLVPERSSNDSDGGDSLNQEEWATKEADDYIDQLVRPR